MSDRDKMWPCLAFAKGQCENGDNCPHRHDSKSDHQMKPCRFFNTKKGCFKGGRCPELHDKSNTLARAPAPPQDSVLEAEFRQWKFQIPRPGSGRFNSVHSGTFFAQGLALIEKGDVGIIQRVIKKLGTEEGLTMIKALTDKMEETDSVFALRTFERKVVPFFKTISHPDAQSSLILETPLETICNFLFGPSGRRAEPVLKFTAQALVKMGQRISNGDGHQGYSAALTASAIVFRNIVELNQSAQILDNLNEIVADIESSIPDDLPLQTARRALNRIKQRLGIGAKFSDKALQVAKIEPAIFELEEDLPGELSENGPRHDNDHADIRNIQILPTVDEIKSDRPEYLPSVNGSSGHLVGVQRLIDRQFRLLREDTVGQLRDTIRAEQEILSQVQHGNETLLRQNKTRHFIYTNIQLLRASFTWRRGLTVLVNFDQPAPSSQPEKRAQWWEDSKRLKPETLVALVTPEKVIFFTVCDARTDDNPSTSYPSLHRDAKWATVGLVMVEPSDEDLIWIAMHVGNDPDMRQSLVELPAVILASFKPTLQALQKMFRFPDIPFAEFLASNETTDSVADVPPPDYAQAQGFAYNLAPIAGGEKLTFAPGKPYDNEGLQEKSTLDDAQKAALLNALSRSLALIQGPPGTGKSYTGVAAIKVLLESRTSSRFGPIICVCYTNHALDQLLEHLLDNKISKIIRMGTRSKSDRLQRLNLYDMKKQIGPTRDESHQQWVQFTLLDSSEAVIQKALFEIQETSSLSSIRNHLKHRYPHHFGQLFSDDIDEQGFKKARRRKNAFGRWLNNGARTGANRPISELLSASAWSMSSVERRNLHAHWVRQQREALVHVLQMHFADYTTHKTNLEKCQQELDIRCLQCADVIGVTTSGLAKSLDILQRVGSKVVVCEEAGEVLEAQTLTMLLPTVEHLILIGDHQQLRPQTNTYEMRQDHPEGQRLSFDVSLFERLVDPKHGNLRLPYSTLEVQRRMHPSIAELVRQTLYPKLKDHPQVHEYPNVDGMRDRLFWLDHQQYEDSVQTNGSSAPFSKTNTFEVGMVEALVSYLVKQGTFKHEDIAVLTPYLGQLRLIRNRLRESFEIVVGERDLDDLENQDPDNTDEHEVDRKEVHRRSLLGAVRVATVDNFQGEEAKVVIISLVRSNGEKKCGFLRTSNRINVLLSRARHGMYIIGNAETASSVPMWKVIISILHQNGKLGDSLALRCPRHEDTPTKVSTPDDFAIYAPEGGCNQKCTWRLKCGHACITKCHSELLHSAVRCLERCQRTRNNCDHPCPKYCGDPCSELCEAPVSNFTLPCGHVKAELPCHQAQEPERASCDVLVQVTLPHCKHEAKLPCSQASNSDSYKCEVICGAVLPCGHDCKRRCHECDQPNREVKVDHGKCTRRCGRAYTTCSHTCKDVCHGDEPCALCEDACEVHCVHSQCKKKCFEPCVPCAEQCSWRCPHQGKCQLPCAVPCDRLPCSKRCELLLECGHQCPSVCGEKCPDAKYCQHCGNASVREQVVDYIMNETYAEVDLSQNPCVVPSCGHILTLESMDGYFGMANYYEMSDEGTIKALKSRSEPFSIKEMKNCPMCRAPLRNVQRYGRIVRRALIDEATKKFIVWANAKFVPLSERLEHCVTRLGAGKIGLRGPWGKKIAETIPMHSMVLNGDSAKQITAISRLIRREPGNEAIRNALDVLRDIKSFLREVDEKEQPFTRVYDLMTDAHRHRGVNTDNSGLHGGPEILQVRHRILTLVLLMRCEYTVLAAFLNSAHGKITVDLKTNRGYCDKLIDECEQRKQPGSKVEGLVSWARFAALECAHPMSPEELEKSGLLDRAQEYLNVAETVCKEYPGQTIGLQTEIEETRTMLQYSTFYRPVTNEERAAVYAAMAKDFRGTGHWYYCQNGHPFTIGECGMPMQSSVCPECGAPVGGHNHTPNEGVTAATDFDRDFANLRV